MNPDLTTIAEEPVVLALDAEGGDNAPTEVVAGALLASFASSTGVVSGTTRCGGATSGRWAARVHPGIGAEHICCRR